MRDGSSVSYTHLVYRRYGPPDVLQIEDVEEPVPKDNEVLVRIVATTVCAADWRLRKADPFFIRFMNGLWRPKKIPTLGMEFAGKVESVGKAVTHFAIGDEVFGAVSYTHLDVYKRQALFRLLRQGLLKAEWGTSENNRRAKFYELTPLGRKRLQEETDGWRRLAAAMGSALGARPEEI